MHHLRILGLLLVLCGSLSLTACGAEPDRVFDWCYSSVPVSSVRPIGRNMSFTLTTVRGGPTYSVLKSAFGGAPAAMKNGDIVTVCVDQIMSNGHTTTTITQFSDQG
jgi:hypothetical protein